MPDLALPDYPGASTAAVAGLQEIFAHTAQMHQRDDLPGLTLTTGQRRFERATA